MATVERRERAGLPAGAVKLRGWPIALPLVQVPRSPFCFLASSSSPRLCANDDRWRGRPRTSPPRPAWVGWIRPSPGEQGSRLTACGSGHGDDAESETARRGEVLFSRTAAHATARADRAMAGCGTLIQTAQFTQPTDGKRGFHVTHLHPRSRPASGHGHGCFRLHHAGRPAWPWCTLFAHWAASIHGAEDLKCVGGTGESIPLQGLPLPNRIPVSLAIKKMVKEQVTVPPLQAPSAEDKSASAELPPLGDCGSDAPPVRWRPLPSQ